MNILGLFVLMAGWCTSVHAMHFEIELKFEVLAKSALSQFLRKLSFQHRKRMIDIYLDTPNADLCQKGLWIRIRDQNRIDYKFNRACIADPTLGMQPYCEEYSFNYPLQPIELQRFNTLNRELELYQAESFEDFMSRNGLIEHRTVDKLREQYTYEGFTIVVDEVADLGTFLEIELMADSANNVAQVKNQMVQILAGLELKQLKTSYDVLLLRKNNFAQYLRSRFILPEDQYLLRAKQ